MLASTPSRRPPEGDPFRDFLNPKSMLTPGVAGAITMLIANTLWKTFAIEPRWTGLIISFMLGLLVLAAVEIVLWQRFVYYVVNSLIIFSVGIGTNSLGKGIEARRPEALQLGGSVAYAQPPLTTRGEGDRGDKLRKREEQLNKLEAALEKATHAPKGEVEFSLLPPIFIILQELDKIGPDPTTPELQVRERDLRRQAVSLMEAAIIKAKAAQKREETKTVESDRTFFGGKWW